MHVILVHGMWLDGSTWDQVVPALERAGHRTHALTLPGMESKDTDRSEITLRDHVDAIVAAIDALDPADGRVVLVGHSVGGVLVHAAADARVDRVARVVYVASEPAGDGEPAGWPGAGGNGEIPFPEWSFFDDEMVADLDDTQRATLRAHAIPWPERVCRDPLRLSDDRRYDVPATVLACEYSSKALQEWIDQKQPGTKELGKLRNAEYADLSCGHWPQVTRPDDLARAILASIDRRSRR